MERLTTKIDDLNKITLKKYYGSVIYNRIALKLEVYNKIISEDRSKLYIEEIKNNPAVDDMTKSCIDFTSKMQDHLWLTIAILSSKNELAKAQLIQDYLVNELCDTVLNPSYFGFKSDEIDDFFKAIKEAVKTHFAVVRWDPSKK